MAFTYFETIQGTRVLINASLVCEMRQSLELDRNSCFLYFVSNSEDEGQLNIEVMGSFDNVATALIGCCS